MLQSPLASASEQLEYGIAFAMTGGPAALIPPSANPRRAARTNIGGLFVEEFIPEMLLEFAVVGNRGFPRYAERSMRC